MIVKKTKRAGKSSRKMLRLSEAEALDMEAASARWGIDVSSSFPLPELLTHRHKTLILINHRHPL